MRNIPTVTRNLLITNTLFFLATAATGRYVDLDSVLGLHFFLAPGFHLWQLVSYMFMHASLSHLFFNMFALWMFGCIVERTWGGQRFLAYYLVCGMGAGLFQEAAQLCQFYTVVSEQVPGAGLLEVAAANGAMLNTWTTVGASGSVYGILLAFGMLYPDDRIFVFPLPVPIKAKWLIAGYFCIEIASALLQPGDNVAHLAHLGGMVVGFLLIRYWRRQAPGARPWTDAGLFGRAARRMKKRPTFRDAGTGSRGGDGHEADWDYNARRRAAQEETDRILDKIRRSGYDSLTAAEKRHLFDQSNNK